MHGVIRRYRVRLGTVEQAAHYAEKGFLPIVRDIPGFVSCHLLDAGNDILTCMALFETEQGAEAAVRASRDWFRDEWSSFRPVPPEVTIGEVLARATADRRAADRRQLALVGAATWSGPERFEGGGVALVRVLGLEHVETQLIRGGAGNLGRGEPEGGLRVDEAANEPGAGDPVHMHAAPGHPGPAVDGARGTGGGGSGPGGLVPLAHSIQRRLRRAATRRAEVIERHDLRQPALEPRHLA